MKYIYKILFLPLFLILAACSSDAPDDVNEAGDSVELSFNMVTYTAITESRADSLGHDEVTSEYRTFEDGVELGELGLFVFAKIAGTTSDEKLVYKLTSFLESDDVRVKITGSKGNYFVSITIFKDDLKDVLGGYELKSEGNAIIAFRMLIVANSSLGGVNENARLDEVNAQTYPAVISQLAEWSYSMDDIYNAAGGPGIESLYGNGQTHIPMFGTNLFAVTEYALFHSTPGDRVFLGAVNLLRSLAKVRVIDNIQYKDNQGYPCITSVELLSSQNQAFQLPAGATNYTDGQQVHKPNIFQENTNLTLAGTYKLGVLPEGWTTVPASKRTGNVFVGFVPEQKIGHPNNNFEEGMPIFHITVANHKADGSFENLDYYVPMTSYNGVNFSFGQNILRNHIYTLSVNNIGALLNIQVDVVPYRSCVLEPYFGLDRD